MPVKYISLGKGYLRTILALAAVVCILFTWFSFRWNLANVVASQVDPKQPDAAAIADWVTKVAPSDPRTHFLAASVLEASFNADELAQSVEEYELAASLSPHQYGLWLSLGRSKSLVGDVEGSFKAFQKALDLAPNYSIVHWVYGNALIREANFDEGLSMIAAAAASDTKYVGPAVSTALQVSDGDPAEVRRKLGDSPAINAGLAKALISQGQFEKASESWNRIPAEIKQTDFKSLGESLRSQLVENKRFRLAADLENDLSSGGLTKRPDLVNGGFEEEIKLGSTDIFDWRVSPGTHPQVGLSDSIKRSGRFSLALVFNSVEAAGLRSIEQTIAVDPGADYELGFFYRSDLRSDAILRWEVVNAANLQSVAESEPLLNTADWKEMKLRFRAPAEADGVQLRLVRTGCGGLTCSMNGRVFFDDVSLRKS